ncbi:bromodomain-containing protein DDB_G0280777-like [Calliphora vicina]|uniref:bromodomain-containing protein DDB_G0280777-like n=1 Tax=Calliphora vicina TaxID=7373 RepID=UPI00325B700B
MMSPKHNDTSSEQINNKLNKVTKATSGATKQKLLIGKTLKEKPITSRQQKQTKKITNAQTAMRYNSNSNKLMVKPIIKNNDSNTSIKASNRTCNLIGEMINDVSKSTISGYSHSKQNDKATKTDTTTTAVAAAAIKAKTTTSAANTLTKKHSSYNCSEGGTNKIADDELVVVDDFHNNNSNNNTNHHTDNEQPHESNQQQQQQQQQLYTMTSLNEVNRESLSLVNEATLVDLITEKQQQQQQQLQLQSKELARAEFEAESLVTVKPPLLLQNFSKRMRHKNITIKPLDDSYQRTVDLDALNAREHNSQCELLEFKNTISENHPQKDYQVNDVEEGEELKFKSLSERKALLKKEFFKDLNQSSSTNQQQQNTVKLKTNNLTLNKRILKKQHNLKLKIPRDCNKLEQPKAIKVDLKQSLVELRKLDLQKKQQRELIAFGDSRILSNTQFPKVKELAKRFDFKINMILPQTNSNKTEAKANKLEAMVERHSPLSDEGCNIGHSPYSSDDDNDSIRTTNTAIERVPATKHKDKVARSASSDSALGLEVDEPMDTSEQQQPHQQKRRMTLTVTDLPLRPALLPLAEPTLLPDSSLVDTPVATAANALQQNQIPTKVLLEERVVEILEDPRSGFSSRRESSQSCFSDYPPGEMQGVRFVRTPSVVVSDYSDDITCGITLEEIEYFRAQRLRRRRSSLETSGTEKDALDNSSDISASSSCSNLYYCGSTISALDGAECLVNGVRQQLERKTSDCSTCSISGDEDNNFTIPEQPEDCQDITDMLANQHLTSKRSKKVGMATNLLTVDTTNNL